MRSTSMARRLSLAVLGLGGIAAAVAAGPPTKPAPTPPQKGVGINIANIDLSVKPCEDFFHYASGNWMKNNPVPAAESRWGSFNELANSNNATLRTIL
ncbi:MAG: M13 family metallopeptidase, partial [Bacteroidota bacterium]|nr:M13 family metallopeptidase [Bacteroidota bacterium]